MPYQIHIFIVKACQCSRRLVMKWYGPIWHWSYYMIISTEPNILKLGFPHFADVNMEFTLVRRSLLHTLSDFEIRNIGSALSLSYSATLLVYGNLYGNKTWTVQDSPTSSPSSSNLANKSLGCSLRKSDLVASSWSTLAYKSLGLSEPSP